MFIIHTLQKSYLVRDLDDLLIFVNWLNSAKIEFKVERL